MTPTVSLTPKQAAMAAALQDTQTLQAREELLRALTKALKAQGINMQYGPQQLRVDGPRVQALTTLTPVEALDVGEWSITARLTLEFSPVGRFLVWFGLQGQQAGAAASEELARQTLAIGELGAKSQDLQETMMGAVRSSDFLTYDEYSWAPSCLMASLLVHDTLSR